MRRAGGRVLAGCCLVFVLAAVALWVSSALPWWRVTAQVPLRGPVPVTFTGDQAWPALLGLAPLALAAVAGVLALAGWTRRVLGGLVGALGLWMVVVAARTVLGSVPDPHDPGYPTPPNGVDLDALRDQAVTVDAGPWPALAGGLGLLAGGLYVLGRERALPRLGSRFRVGHDRPRQPDQERDWWGALDEGHDPTSSGGSGADPRPSH